MIDLLYRIRRLLYAKGFMSSHELIPKTISVGNIELGGTGKTPFTVWLGCFLESCGQMGVVLTRGYKRESNKSPIVQITPINRESLNVSDVGDEALLISKKLKKSSVIVGPNRLAGYFNRPLIHRDDFVLLEDGHQHLKIRRDLNIVLINSTTEVDKFKCPPSGYLREGVSSLMEADILIFTKCQDKPTDNEKLIRSLISDFLKPDALFGRVKFSPSHFENLKTREIKNLIDLSSMECGVFCGIATPGQFLGVLSDLNLNIRKELILDNHHKFKESTYSKINEMSDERFLICTEKDAIKIDPQKVKGDVLSLVSKVVFLEGEDKIKEKIKSLDL